MQFNIYTYHIAPNNSALHTCKGDGSQICHSFYTEMSTKEKPATLASTNGYKINSTGSADNNNNYAQGSQEGNPLVQSLVSFNLSKNS